MAEPHLRVIPDIPLQPTAAGWVEVILGQFDRFLQDHASCEKKASGMALNIASHYPDRPDLLNAMAELAVEELSHYREVIKLLTERGVVPGPDQRDPYIGAMNRLIRQGPERYLMDRLLVAAVVERRGHERFGLVAEALPEGGPRRFYRAITASEYRHWQLFLDLALAHCDARAVPARLQQIVDAEAEILGGLPWRPALH